MPVFTYTRTNDGYNKENLRQDGEMFQDLAFSFQLVLIAAKRGTTSLVFENMPGHEMDSVPAGRVVGEDFTIEFTDKYGDNPEYIYRDNNGSIFIQSIFGAINSSVTAGEKTYTCGNVMNNPEAANYVQSVNKNITELVEMSRESVDSGKQTKK